MGLFLFCLIADSLGWRDKFSKNQKTKKTKKTKKQIKKFISWMCIFWAWVCRYFGLECEVGMVCFISQLIAQKKEGKIKKNQKTLKDKKNPYSWVYRFLNVYTYGMEFGCVALGSFANYLGHG